jgi:hypothetical protein
LEGASDTVVNLDRVNFSNFWAYVAAAICAALLWTTLAGVLLQPAALAVLVVPFFLRRYLAHRREQQIQNEIRLFLLDLRLALSGHGTLLQALRSVSRNGPPVLSSLLKSYLAGYQGSGLEILEHLATDTKNTWLQDVASRASASQSGLLGLDDAIRQSLDRVVKESDTLVHEQMQRIPNRLTLLVFPILLGPAIVVWMYPLGIRLLETIGGVSSLGGF